MIDSLWSYTLLALSSLLAVLNPFATVPPFIAMTAANTVEERLTMATRAAVIAFCILSLFALSGLRVLAFFGISVPAFQIAGGLVLVRVAFELLQGSGSLKVTPEERLEGAQKDDISITPLAVPILCGPATITAAVLLSSQAATWFHAGILVAAIGITYSGILVLLRLASAHSHRLGDTTIKVSSRLMGLILVAIAVQFVLEGIRAAQVF
jgi:multiple antibiotic resistance protein